MRYTILYIYILFYFNTFAQHSSEVNKKVDFNIIIPNTINTSFFKKHTEIEKVVINYYDYKDKSCFIYFKKNETDSSQTEFYDLSFKGDSLVFLQRYGILDLNFPTINLKRSIWNPSDNLFTHSIKASITKDSINYYYKRIKTTSSSSRSINELGIGTSAKPRIKVSKIEALLINELKAKGIKNTDQQIVFEVLINKEGNLEQMQQLVGLETDFSKVIKSIFEKKINNWYPAKIRRPIETYVKVFIQTSSDG